MLKVLTKTVTFVEGVWHKAGEEITIFDHHFSDEVHTILEDLGIDKKPVGNPVIPGREPPAATEAPSTPAATPAPAVSPAPPVSPDAPQPAPAPAAPTSSRSKS
jgi:hypothetical protein